MKRFILRSKIHRAVVTGADVEYEGSITIDASLIEAACISEYERVDVYNICNGKRFQTYVISGTRGSGVICVNGAAAQLVDRGDKIIIACYGLFDEVEARGHIPSMIYVDRCNNIIKVKGRGEGVQTDRLKAGG